MQKGLSALLLVLLFGIITPITYAGLAEDIEKTCVSGHMDPKACQCIGKNIDASKKLSEDTKKILTEKPILGASDSLNDTDGEQWLEVNKIFYECALEAGLVGE